MHTRVHSTTQSLETLTNFWPPHGYGAHPRPSRCHITSPGNLAKQKDREALLEKVVDICACTIAKQEEHPVLVDDDLSSYFPYL